MSGYTAQSIVQIGASELHQTVSGTTLVLGIDADSNGTVDFSIMFNTTHFVSSDIIF